MTDKQFTITLFQNVGDSMPQVVTRTWAQLCKKFSQPQVREDKDGLLFSPAKYRGNRRLQTNVIELSMLVLEIDGAWRCACCGHPGPHVMFVSNRVKAADGRIDRSPRCPACLKAKCEKCYRAKPKPHTETTLTRIEFTFESVIAGMRSVFVGCAFAIYSTHSHQRVTATKCGVDGICGKCAEAAGWPNRTVGIEDAATDEAITTCCGAVFGHEVAEPCYRLIVLLAWPVLVADYASLWTWAVNSLHESEVIADPQAKDPNRIFYTPVKASDDAAYEWHVEPGELFDWKESLELWTENQGLRSNAASLDATKTGVVRTSGHSDQASQSSVLSPFNCHEDRHDELCRRIMARGKQNTRGHYDAKCLAHNGRGDTSLVYFPDSGAVQCNAGCDYFIDILPAEGLPNQHLPTRDRLSVEASRNANLKTLNLRREKGLTLLTLDCIYSFMLAHLFELSAEHEANIRKHWQQNPFGEMVDWFGGEEKPARPVKICSMPNDVQKAQAARLLSERFDLREVPGFYLSPLVERPHAPSREIDLQRWQSENFGQWRINLPFRQGLLVPYYDDNGSYVIGIQIYRDVHDNQPTLLTSRGLLGGAKALTLGVA